MPRDFDGAIVYLVRCADGAYYCGSCRKPVEERVGEHNAAVHSNAFTASRRPVDLVWSEHFQSITDAIACERRIKGWSRAKKEALIRGDWDTVRQLARSRQRSVE
jgi:putative endonuclease